MLVLASSSPPTKRLLAAAALAFAIISSLLLVQTAGIGASGQLYQLHPSERLVHLPTGIPTDLSTDREQFPLTLNAYDAKLQMGPYNDISSSSVLHPLLELPDSVTALATCDKLQVSSVRASSNDGNVPSNAIDNSHGARWSDNGVGAWIQLDLVERLFLHNNLLISFVWQGGDITTIYM